ncbi:hypothetical protein ACLESD_17765 [Pyxidicoccus sp. 3LFB2]
MNAANLMNPESLNATGIDAPAGLASAPAPAPRAPAAGGGPPGTSSPRPVT